MNNTIKMTGQEIIKILKGSELTIENFAYDEIPYNSNTISIDAEAAQKKRDEWLNNNPSSGYNSENYQKWKENYSLFPSKYDILAKEWLEANNIPTWEEVEQYGGEGQEDTWYSVKYFKDHDVYLRVDGYYQSHSGTDFESWDSAVSIVKPQQKTITVYN